MTAALWFVAPDFTGLPSGGTLYNRALVAALEAAAVPVRVLDLDAARSSLGGGDGASVWVDSLYLAAVPELHRRVRRGRLGLLLHYLPSLLEPSPAGPWSRLSELERRALSLADAVLVTSRTMRAAMQQVGVEPERLLVVEPASSFTFAASLPPAAVSGVRAVLVAHLFFAKRVEPLLLALAAQLKPDDRFHLCVVGDVGADPACGARALKAAARPELAGRVQFAGVVPPAAVAERLQASNLFVSASAMESYGMALAEARRTGLPIVACAGGNVVEHVTAEAGGELVRDVPALARACLRLSRDPNEHAERLRRARRARTPPRLWSTAASDFLAQLPWLDRPLPPSPARA
ncbi:MAG TPA: glycosyltransferase [Polyangiaceae bacterium]